MNVAVFATSSSMDFASSNFVTVGSSQLPFRPYESVFRTSEPEKPPCSLVTTMYEQPLNMLSSSRTCGAGASKLSYKTRGRQRLWRVQVARKARLRSVESQPALQLDHEITSPVHVDHDLWSHCSELLAALGRNWIA